MDESRAKWDKQRDEMLEEIIEIKERNQFKDIDLQAHEKESPAERNGSKMSQRLVITKHARNDQRIVEPKIENGNSNRTIQKDAGDDECKFLVRFCLLKYCIHRKQTMTVNNVSISYGGLSNVFG